METGVTTRSFTQDDRFWEISWTGGVVEVASGKIGKAGRAKEYVFESRSELDAFILDQTSKIVRKGFVECDPASLKAVDPNDAFERKVQTAMDRLRRTTWIPVLEPDTPCRADASKLGGLPWLKNDESSPKCAGCNEELVQLLQLRKTDAPPEWSHAFSSTAIQFFLCESGCDTLRVSGAVLLRHVDLDSTGAVRFDREAYYAGKRIIRFEPKDDYPSSDIEKELGGSKLASDIAEVFDERGIGPIHGEKLGGWPYWVHDAEYPTCRCGERTQFFFQIDSSCALTVVWGDCGTSWIFSCETCKALSFRWNCT